MKIQRSIGINSLGNPVWLDVAPDELDSVITTAAAANGYDAGTVRAKLDAGRTIWLTKNHLKLRGYVDGQTEQVFALAEQAIAASRAADGYEEND